MVSAHLEISCIIKLMYIGIDVGGSNIRIASFKSLESSNFEQLSKFEITNDYEKDLGNIIHAILNLTKEEIEGIGIGVPAVLNEEKTQILNANNIKSWTGKPLREDLLAKFNCPVILENDATAAALGEAIYGSGVNKSFLFIIWGTGIGGTFVNRVHDDSYAISSQLGHQIVKWNGLTDTCRQRGCFEAYCSGGGIERRFGKPASQLSEENWKEVEEIFAQGLLNSIAIYPVNLVIFSGGVALKQKKRIKNIGLILRKNLKMVPVPQLVLSKLGENAGVFGALTLLR